MQSTTGKRVNTARAIPETPREQGFAKPMIAEAGLEAFATTTIPGNELQKTKKTSAAKSGALRAKDMTIETELQRVIDSWPNLDQTSRDRITRIIESKL